MENEINIQESTAPMSEEKTSTTKNEKNIIIALTIAFAIVLIGALWDMYGRALLTGYSHTPPEQILNNNTQTTNPNNKKDMNIGYSSYSTCLENTKDESSAKDCCDCLSADVSVRKACRDATVSYDFSKNTNIKNFTIPSKFGRNSDYSTYTTSGNQQQCKQMCESASSGLVCGDYQFCRTACNSLPK